VINNRRSNSTFIRPVRFFRLQQRNYGKNLSMLANKRLMRAAKVVIPVPQLAESLSEGTVKQLIKRMNFFLIFLVLHVEVGDFVEQDEEITSIETDKVFLP